MGWKNIIIKTILCNVFFRVVEKVWGSMQWNNDEKLLYVESILFIIFLIANCVGIVLLPVWKIRYLLLYSLLSTGLFIKIHGMGGVVLHIIVDIIFLAVLILLGYLIISSYGNIRIIRKYNRILSSLMKEYKSVVPLWNEHIKTYNSYKTMSVVFNNMWSEIIYTDGYGEI